MTDESKNYEMEEIPEEKLEQVAGGAMVVKNNVRPDKDRVRPGSDEPANDVDNVWW